MPVSAYRSERWLAAFRQPWNSFSRRCRSSGRGRGRSRRSRLGGAFRRLGGGFALAGLFFLLRRLVAGQVALLVLVGFEIRFIPAAAGQPERRRGHLPLDRSRLAFRTFGRIRIGQFLQAVEAMPAGLATESIDWHGTFPG